MARRWICALAGAFSWLTAGADDLTGREQLNATLWMQTAPEYRAIAAQVYRLATEKLATPTAGSAALEQANVPAERLARLPTAVVLDLDETVLDNTVYQARLIRDRAIYNPQSWGEWVRAGEAEAVPGAREFIAAARRLGHAVFYITNRDCTIPAPTSQDKCPAKTATMRNLVALGIDPAPDPAHMLVRNERPEWNTGTKTHRRAFIAANYRIIALVGDDLGDFVDPAPDPSHMLVRNERPEWNTGTKTHRRAFIAANYRIVALVGDDLGDFVDPRAYAGDRARLEPRFGISWFLLPNPIYGSWIAPFDTMEEKYAGLHTGDVVLELPGGGPWANADRVRIASWNLEYLMTPATHVALSASCAENGGMVGGDDRMLPCAITKRAPRGADDYASLRRYATELRADIVALQEVDGPDAAAQVFPGYDFCFSTRAHTQKNGFAIRRGLQFRCEPEYEPLSLNNAVRRGVVATFFPGTDHEFQLMSVHLKSGCPAGPLTAPGRNCELLSRQVAPIEDWIDAEARAGRRFGLLGDFNRRFTIEKGGARDADGRQLNVYAEIADGDPPAAKLTNVTAKEKFTPCTTDSEYREFIDNILLGRDLAKTVRRKSFVRVVYDDADAKAHWLSDHCPVGIELRLR